MILYVRPTAGEDSRQRVSLGNKTVIKQWEKQKLISYIILLRSLSFAHSFGNFNNSLMREVTVVSKKALMLKKKLWGKTDETP